MGTRSFGCYEALLLLVVIFGVVKAQEPYRPPLLGPPAPVPYNPPVASSPYQPPLPLRSNDYQQVQPPASLQGFVLQNKPQASHSVQYVPPSLPLPQLQQSFSVQQAPPFSSAQRTESVHQQSIHKAPASEVSSAPAAKDRDAREKDEYVVYYYYYYDNDTTPNANLSLSFDDIPSLESYDGDSEKASNALGTGGAASSIPASQPRSVDSQPKPAPEPLPLKPVSNVFRYGGNELPRFPVLPNFVVAQATTTPPPETTKTDLPTRDPPTTRSTQIEPLIDDDPLSNSINGEHESRDGNDAEVEEELTTIPTTTMEPTTTTEEPTTTTTTERPRRRPGSVSGGRRRFSPAPSPGRGRQNPTRASATSSSTSSTTSTTTTASPRRTFGGSNRIRPRPSVGSNRPRPGARATEAEQGVTTTPSTTSTTARSRFSSAAPRRFQSSRSRSQASTSSSTSTTSTTSRPPAPSRSRPSIGGVRSRPPSNALSNRSRPPRPGFLRPRQEEAETTTTPAAEETPAPEEDTLPAEEDEDDNVDDNATEEEEEEAAPTTTTTEANRFSALFRPRNRVGGARPRPPLGNRPRV